MPSLYIHTMHSCITTFLHYKVKSAVKRNDTINFLSLRSLEAGWGFQLIQMIILRFCRTQINTLYFSDSLAALPRCLSVAMLNPGYQHPINRRKQSWAAAYSSSQQRDHGDVSGQRTDQPSGQWGGTGVNEPTQSWRHRCWLPDLPCVGCTPRRRFAAISRG